ncbi:hypothetical protein COT72_01530 [archaeon CG10_big_fil_rev_8_21_14_0_10_43_11]|nr:MAG: hypothetical protein COT72_01530 [archaeon CG10_big_fil_rev_8_21_14_0_10_43_11]
MARLFLIDIDGTLLDTDGNGHNAKLMHVLSKLKEKGHTIGLVTGREAESALTIRQVFGLNGPVISENGCELYLFTGKKQKIVLGRLDEVAKKKVRKTIAKQGVFEDFRHVPERKNVFMIMPKAFPNHDPALIARTFLRVKRALEEQQEVSVLYSSSGIAVIPKQVSKAKAITQYCKDASWKLRDVVYAGDSKNDVSAFRLVGKHEGTLIFVGTDKNVQKEIETFNPIIPKAKHSQGCGEALSSFL